MELFTAAVTSRESAGQPYTVVKLSGEADITVSGKLRDTLDAEVSRQPEGSSSTCQRCGSWTPRPCT